MCETQASSYYAQGIVNGLVNNARVLALRPQTGAQYLAVEWIKASVAIRSVEASAPLLVPANHLKSRTGDINFLRSDFEKREFPIHLYAKITRFRTKR